MVGVTLDGELKSIMGKVEEIKVVNGEWQIRTSPIAIEEFIYSGTISGTVYRILYENNTIPGSSPLMMIQDVEGFPSYGLLNEDLNGKRATTNCLVSNITRHTRLEFRFRLSI